MVYAARLAWGTVLFSLLFLVWIALDGSDALLLGALSAAGAAWLATRLAPRASLPWRPGALLGFVAYFLVESLRGGADVAWRALRRDLPIDPQLIRHDVALPPGPARTLLIGVISLLPGTLSADASDDGATVWVHALGPGALAGIDTLEARIAALYGVALERAA